tara:strand:+ start:425 stop:925 length:501 start_codon:yes stop_codon:yes gene_type:complete
VISGDGGMAHPTGFEPVIPGFVDRCLIQFGHGCSVGSRPEKNYLEERITSQGVKALCHGDFVNLSPSWRFSSYSFDHNKKRYGMTSVAHPMVLEGVQLMLIGMGTVFVFLTLLVVAVRTMSALILMYFPPVPIQTNKAVVNAEGVPRAHVAAVAAAIEKHRGSQAP